MAPRKKSKAKKPTETMRQRQMRLRAEQQAAKQRGGSLAKTKQSKPASTRVEKVKVKDVTPSKSQLKIKGGSAQKALPPGKKGGALGRAVRGVKGATGSAAVGKLLGRITTPLAAAAEVKEMTDRAKRDDERNKKLGRTPFGPSGQYRRAAEARQGTTKRNRQGQKVKKVQGLPADYKATEAKAFAAAPKPKTSEAKPAAKAPAKPTAKTPAAKPAAKKPAAKTPERSKTYSQADMMRDIRASDRAAARSKELKKLKELREEAKRKSLEQAKKNRSRRNTTARGPRD